MPLARVVGVLGKCSLATINGDGETIFKIKWEEVGIPFGLVRLQLRSSRYPRGDTSFAPLVAVEVSLVCVAGGCAWLCR
jgi:hypothetical protein